MNYNKEAKSLTLRRGSEVSPRIITRIFCLRYCSLLLTHQSYGDALKALLKQVERK